MHQLKKYLMMNCIRHSFIVYIYPVFINKRVFRFILMLAFYGCQYVFQGIGNVMWHT